MPSASFVVARSFDQHIIGCDNALPWRLRTDLRRFRELTIGHAVIMGRKTFDSIGKPLPNRFNIVLSKDKRNGPEGVTWVTSAEDAVFLADYWSICRGKDDFFVIGGDNIYSMFAKKDFYNKVYLTEVFAANIRGDAFFDLNFDKRTWKLVEEVDYPASELDQYPFRFVTYERRQKTIRERLRSDFMTDVAGLRFQKEKLDAAIDRWDAIHSVGPNKTALQLQLAW
ncbi:MAG: dihydrofolate reductase [Methyloceanibacter sp.]